MKVFLKNIFKERTKFDGLQVEATNEKIQSKIRDSYGPLANIWQYLEGLNAAKKETVNVNMEHLLSCTQQTILLFQQSLNIMMYHRKYYALLSIMSHAGCQAKLQVKVSYQVTKDTCLGKNSKHILRKTRGQKVKPCLLSNQRRSMDISFEEILY